MRTLFACLLINSLTLVAFQQPARQESDPYSLVPVRNAMDRLSAGLILSIDAKLITRLGDRCSIAILKIVDENPL
jgi:hypothetical protein